MNFDYFIPTKILFGEGKLNQLAKETLPGKKALVVISSGTSMKKYGYLDRVVNLLKEQNIDSIVFDKVLPNPIKDNVMEGAAVAKENNCDFIIGLGGGSSIDAAKSIAIMAKNPGDYWDYIHGGTGKGQPIKNGALPIVAITTTAGTGTEADPWTVVTNGNEKIGFGDIGLTFPVLSIVDPELMVSIPAKFTAYQGFDAFFHAAEGYIATCSDPMSDLFALESIRLVAEYLPRAVANGNDMEARGKVALANTLSGMVESTSSCTSEHSFEHAMSGFNHDITHGAGLIMLSKSYFSFFANVLPERYSKMANAMGGTDFITCLLDLQEKCGVGDLKMSEHGIAETDLPGIMRNARETMGGLFTVDPVQLTDEDSLKILQEAYS